VEAPLVRKLLLILVLLSTLGAPHVLTATSCYATNTASSQAALLTLLRTHPQGFDKKFEGFSSYTITIHEIAPQLDGSQLVTAEARGTFLGLEKRMTVLFLIMGDQILGGQILSATDLQPCTKS